MKKRIIFFTLSTLALSTKMHADVASELNWKSCKHPKPTQCALCNGYYDEPENIKKYPNPPPYKTTKMTITAKGPVIFRENGDSVLEKKVVVSQPGRAIYADKAIIKHNEKTGKITDIRLLGHVRAEEFGKLLAGKQAHLNIVKNSFTINHAVYHLAGSHSIISIKTTFDAWGVGESIHSKNRVITLKNATYSTCAPKNPTWILSAKALKLDRNKQRCYAKNVVIRFKHVPIAYLPYISFSTDNSRKSGFLAPNLGYATDHGFYIGVPYYWNMAPNYDLLFTPYWYSERGVQFSSLFRYLSHRSQGQFYASFIPNDKKFNDFKNSTLDSFAGKTLSPQVSPYISELNGMSSDRAFFDFTNEATYNEKLDSTIAIRYVTDPYYPRDFSSDYLSNNTNQLPSFAKLHYHGDHWHDTFLLQAYQTLHSLDHLDTPAYNQYQRLPEFDTNANYPHAFHGNNLLFNGQFIHFRYESAFEPFTFERPIGDRIHLQPAINHPFTWANGYITPALTLDSTSYFAQMPTTNNSVPRNHFDSTRALPIIDIDGGLYFDRIFHFHNTGFIQTFEPRLYYLYTPYLNQDSYPNFDTQLLPFSVTDLYTLNRFYGYDRLQNANQVSIGLTTRTLSENTANNILSAQLGFIGYFSTPRVCLTPNCTITDRAISPITGSLTFYPSSRWSLTGSMAWDTAIDQINNLEIGGEYHLDNRHIVVLNYQFTHANNDTPFEISDANGNASLIKAGLVWPLNNRWKVFGYTYYNLTLSRPEDQYVGLSYNTCCWALRFIVKNNYDGNTRVDGGTTVQNQYTTNYFVEFSLKGLGSAGNHSAENLLTSTLPGFEDMFSNRTHYGYDQRV